MFKPLVSLEFRMISFSADELKPVMLANSPIDSRDLAWKFQL